MYGQITPSVLGSGSFPAIRSQAQGIRENAITSDNLGSVDACCGGALTIGWSHPTVEAALFGLTNVYDLLIG